MQQNKPLTPSNMRTDYARGELHESDASTDPIEQFSRWFTDANHAGVPEPTAMTLATAEADGKPSARIVLLKEFDVHGFVFFTNRSSRKGRELADNPRASLVFFWQQLERQVRIDGSVEQVSREESEKYFHSRPIASQIGALASRQSSVISSRDELEKKETILKSQFEGRQIPLPDFWGGYRVIPTEMEFWQGRPSRLHDRLRYRLVDSKWIVERLSP